MATAPSEGIRQGPGTEELSDAAGSEGLGRCPACEGQVARWREATASDPARAAHPAYELVRCPQCGTAATLEPDPEHMALLYEEGTYRAPSRALDRVISPLRRLADADRMRFVRRLPRRARVLEIGAGDGAFLARLATAGFRVSGIEPSGSACERARARGLAVERARIEDVRLPPASEDAVILWHVLEHLVDPKAVLERVRGCLVPGGALIVAVPNLDSFQAKLGGDRWFHQDVPRHRTHFTADGLGRLLERLSFRVDRTRHLLVEQNPLGMWQTLLNRLTAERDVPFRAIKRDLSFRSRRDAARDLCVSAVAGPLLVPVAVGVELAAGMLRHGGSIVVEARRP